MSCFTSIDLSKINCSLKFKQKINLKRLKVFFPSTKTKTHVNICIYVYTKEGVYVHMGMHTVTFTHINLKNA